MNAEHLTVYYDKETQLFYVDNDGPDNKDGTRNPGGSGWSFNTPEAAAACVQGLLEEMA